MFSVKKPAYLEEGRSIIMHPTRQRDALNDSMLMPLKIDDLLYEKDTLVLSVKHANQRLLKVSNLGPLVVITVKCCEDMFCGNNYTVAWDHINIFRDRQIATGAFSNDLNAGSSILLITKRTLFACILGFLEVYQIK